MRFIVVLALIAGALSNPLPEKKSLSEELGDVADNPLANANALEELEDNVDANEYEFNAATNEWALKKDAETDDEIPSTIVQKDTETNIPSTEISDEETPEGKVTRSDEQMKTAYHISAKQLEDVKAKGYYDENVATKKDAPEKEEVTLSDEQMEIAYHLSAKQLEDAKAKGFYDENAATKKDAPEKEVMSKPNPMWVYVKDQTMDIGMDHQDDAKIGCVNKLKENQYKIAKDDAKLKVLQKTEKEWEEDAYKLVQDLTDGATELTAGAMTLNKWINSSQQIETKAAKKEKITTDNSSKKGCAGLVKANRRKLASITKLFSDVKIKDQKWANQANEKLLQWSKKKIQTSTLKDLENFVRNSMNINEKEENHLMQGLTKSGGKGCNNKLKMVQAKIAKANAELKALEETEKNWEIDTRKLVKDLRDEAKELTTGVNTLNKWIKSSQQIVHIAETADSSEKGGCDRKLLASKKKLVSIAKVFADVENKDEKWAEDAKEVVKWLDEKKQDSMLKRLEKFIRKSMKINANEEHGLGV